MNSSATVSSPSSSVLTSAEAPSDTGAGDIQTDGLGAAGTQQKRGLEMADSQITEQQNNTLMHAQQESVVSVKEHREMSVSTDNPEITAHKETAEAASPEGLSSPGVDSSQDTSPHTCQNDNNHLEDSGWKNFPSGDNHHPSEHEHYEPQAARDSSVGGRRDSVDDSRSYSTEDETSDWETPVDVELEPVGFCQRSSKAAWSTVKALTKLMPMAHRSVPWSQLAGHKGSFLAGPDSTVLKLRDPCEEKNLTKLKEEKPGSLYRRFLPQYHGTVKKNGIDYVRMQDLQSEFSSPSVMDIKMGVRTYLEKELAKAEKEPTLRKDLYDKMVSVDPEAPTSEEKMMKAITKTRYLKFRDDTSSSSSLGFRIEGIKTPGIASKDFKKTRSRDDVQKVLTAFVGDNSKALDEYVSLLQDIHREQESSPFFRSHEIVGSSLLFIHDSSGKAGVWMIDFAKCSPLPAKATTDHTSPWTPGNYEDGYWLGLDNVRAIFQQTVAENGQ